MKIYKIAQNKTYSIWLSEQIKNITNNYSKPLGFYESYIPKIEKWVKETNPNLENLTLDDAAKKAISHEHDKVDEYSPEAINRNMNAFHSESQNISPIAPSFAVDSRLKHKSIPPSIKRKINNRIHDLGNYHKEIPLQDIFDICEQNGVVPLQEDGTYWNGILLGGAECGTEEANKQIADFDLAVKTEEGYVPANNTLRLTWCKMESGRYEIVCYLG